ELAQAAQRKLEFLAEASAVLSSSLNYTDSLQLVARLTVPFLADWCVFDVVEEDGSMRRVAVAHEDPTKAELARVFKETYQPDPTRIKGIMRVLRTGEPEIIPELHEAMLAAAARDKTHLKALQNVGARSVLIAPLIARNRG